MNQITLFHLFRKVEKSDKEKGSYFVYNYLYSTNDIVAAREKCEGTKGEYVYTFEQAWFGNDNG